MGIGLLVISHNGIGMTLIDTAVQTLGGYPLPIEVLSVSKDCHPEVLLNRARQTVLALDQGRGVLVLTDLYGATPSNIAMRLMNSRVRIVTGLNLPMLMRVLNYPHLDLDQLVEKAVSGGREGVFLVTQEA